jgi:hypothetical protein
MTAKCKNPNEACANQTLYHGQTYCDGVPCSLHDELPPRTNADRIRSMTDEELARELTRNPTIPCRVCEYHDKKLNTCGAWAENFTCVVEYADALTLDYLKQPAKEEV